MNLHQSFGRWTTHVSEGWLRGEARPEEDVELAIQWWGTAGFRVLSRGHHVWLDPHLSRHTLRELALTAIAPKLDQVADAVDRADAVMVGHSHFDHALDAPAIAQLRGARVYGAADTLQWCRGYGVAESQLTELRGEGESFEQGPFRLRGYKSAHSPMLAGRIPLPGRIERPFSAPARYGAWRVGQVLTLELSTPRFTIAHIGSAELVESELQGARADIVLCCTIGRHATPRFVERVVATLRPKVLLPCHWDQFWRPLDATPLQIPGNDLVAFIDDVARQPHAPEVRVLPPRGWAVWR